MKLIDSVNLRGRLSLKWLPILVLAALSVFAVTAHAATLQVDGGGILTGATGVDVNGTLYDVSFTDGSCIDLFDGCDDDSDFLFVGYAAGLAAVQALSTQVFLDTVDGQFDSNPFLTKDCPPATTAGCAIWSPFIFVNASYIQIYGFNNGYTEGGDYFAASAIDSYATFAGSYGQTYAVWSVATTVVPIPAAAWLFGSALGLLGWMRRKAA